MADREIVVGVSGGSGALLAKRFVEIALAAKGLGRLHFVISDAALRVARNEIAAGITSPETWVSRLETSRALASRLTIHANADVGAAIASGSYPVSGMAVVPCSAGTLGSIANGVSRDLLQRAADVCLKERRTLLLAFRESPYSLIHIENMRRAATAGAIIAPPLPAFYIDAPSIDRFLDAWCVRAVRALGLEPGGEQFQWNGKPGAAGASASPKPRRRPR